MCIEGTRKSADIQVKTNGVRIADNPSAFFLGGEGRRVLSDGLTIEITFFSQLKTANDEPLSITNLLCLGGFNSLINPFFRALVILLLSCQQILLCYKS